MTDETLYTAIITVPYVLVCTGPDVEAVEKEIKLYIATRLAKQVFTVKNEAGKSVRLQPRLASIQKGALFEVPPAPEVPDLPTQA